MRTILMTSCVILGSIGSASAQTTYDWNNPNGGDYHSPINWSPLGPPPAGHIARFPLASTYSVNFTASASAFRYTVVQGNVTWNLNNFNYQTTDTINNGIGNNVTPASLRINGGNFFPGNFGAGESADVVSSVTLDQGVDVTVGAGVFYVGTSGTGNVTIRNGSTLTTTSGMAGIALNASGIGTVTVEGGGSTLTIPGNYRVGGSGNGTLNVLSSGIANVGSLDIGQALNGIGTLTVSGAGSSLTSSGTTNIGGSSANFPAAQATFNVGAGATVNLNGVTNLRTNATINVHGGTLNMGGLTTQPGAAVNWTSGNISVSDGATLTGPNLNLFLGGTNTLGSNRTLTANAGTMTLATPLTVNGGTLNAPTLNLNAPIVVGPFGTVMSNDLVTIGSGQTVQIADQGTLGATAAIFNSGGTLQLNGPAARVTGFFANNAGIVQGTGRFTAGMNNGTGGTIRARAGDHLIIDQVGMTNPGNIELSGGVLEYTRTLSNLSNGFISGRGEFRGGTMTPGSNGLSNQGVVAFSGGTTDVRGDVINAGSGRIVAAGAGVITFYDDVTHNGAEMRVNAGSRMVFFGAQSGAGPFTGTGTVEYNGDLRPGNSPARVTYEGEVILNQSLRTIIELGGPVPGVNYDQLSIAGPISLDGTLQTELIGGFMPAIGQQFMIVENLGAGPISGTFNALSEGSLFNVGAFQFQITYAGGTGNDVMLITTVPEPGALVLMGVGAVVFFRIRRCRHWLRPSQSA